MLNEAVTLFKSHNLQVAILYLISLIPSLTHKMGVIKVLLQTSNLGQDYLPELEDLTRNCTG